MDVRIRRFPAAAGYPAGDQRPGPPSTSRRWFRSGAQFSVTATATADLSMSSTTRTAASPLSAFSRWTSPDRSATGSTWTCGCRTTAPGPAWPQPWRPGRRRERRDGALDLGPGRSRGQRGMRGHLDRDRRSRLPVTVHGVSPAQSNEDAPSTATTQERHRPSSSRYDRAEAGGRSPCLPRRLGSGRYGPGGRRTDQRWGTAGPPCPFPPSELRASAFLAMPSISLFVSAVRPGRRGSTSHIRDKRISRVRSSPGLGWIALRRKLQRWAEDGEQVPIGGDR